MKRVLIVDDDPCVVEVIAANLQAEGYEVETASDGDEAWRRVTADMPDLIVLDWMLPGRTGLELLADLRRDGRASRVPIVLLTAKARDSEIWEGWQAGADYYLTKPFQMEQLLYYLDVLLGAEADAGLG